jgi:hypothetical protein
MQKKWLNFGVSQRQAELFGRVTLNAYIKSGLRVLDQLGHQFDALDLVVFCWRRKTNSMVTVNQKIFKRLPMPAKA